MRMGGFVNKLVHFVFFLLLQLHNYVCVTCSLILPTRKPDVCQKMIAKEMKFDLTGRNLPIIEGFNWLFNTSNKLSISYHQTTDSAIKMDRLEIKHFVSGRGK